MPEKESPKEEIQIKSWKRVYLFVLINLGALILLFYLFSSILNEQP